MSDLPEIERAHDRIANLERERDELKRLLQASMRSEIELRARVVPLEALRRTMLVALGITLET